VEIPWIPAVSGGEKPLECARGHTCRFPEGRRRQDSGISLDPRETPRAQQRGCNGFHWCTAASPRLPGDPRRGNTVGSRCPSKVYQRSSYWLPVR
jgi:hypothetical protein